MPDSVNTNTGHPVQFEFQINKTMIFNLSMSQILHGTYTKNYCLSEIKTELGILYFTWQC